MVLITCSLCARTASDSEQCHLDRSVQQHGPMGAHHFCSHDFLDSRNAGGLKLPQAVSLQPSLVQVVSQLTCIFEALVHPLPCITPCPTRQSASLCTIQINNGQTSSWVMHSKAAVSEAICHEAIVQNLWRRIPVVSGRWKHELGVCGNQASALGHSRGTQASLAQGWHRVAKQCSNTC